MSSTRYSRWRLCSALLTGAVSLNSNFRKRDDFLTKQTSTTKLFDTQISKSHFLIVAPVQAMATVGYQQCQSFRNRVLNLFTWTIRKRILKLSHFSELWWSSANAPSGSNFHFYSCYQGNSASHFMSQPTLMQLLFRRVLESCVKSANS